MKKEFKIKHVTKSVVPVKPILNPRTPLYKLSYTPILKLWDMARSDLINLVGTTHTVKGWIRNARPQSKCMFLKIFDGSHPVPLQLIYGDINDAVRQKIELKAHIGTCITATGIIVKSPGKGQSIELQIRESEVIGPIADPTTFIPGMVGMPIEKIRPHQDVRALVPVYSSKYRIRSKLAQFVHEYMHGLNIHHLDPNVITKAHAEGGAEVFTITNLLKDGDLNKIPFIEVLDEKTGQMVKKVDFSKDFFLEQTYLTESSQLQLEALCRGMGASYTMNTSFRAEPSKTRRHMCSFTHLEWELPFIQLSDLMDFSEDQVTTYIRRVLDECFDDLLELEQNGSAGVIEKLKSFIANPFERITYDQAIDILEKNKDDVMKHFGSEIKKLPLWGEDLGSDCERYIAEIHLKKPTFVYNYPRDLKSFYMKLNPPYEVTLTDGTKQIRHTCQGCDLLLPGLGELIGSSMRIDNYEELEAEMDRRKMDKEPYQWYMDLRRNGSWGHGGAGLGFDRLVDVCTSGYVNGNIRDVTPFPVAYQECGF